MRLVQATKREIEVSKRKGAVPGDSGADAAASPSGKSDKSDVKVIPNERLERARAKKYGIPYDPEHTAWIKAYVKWKRENHRLMLARGRTQDKQPHTAESPGSATVARKKVCPPKTPDVKKPIKLSIVGRDGYKLRDFHRDFPGVGFSLPGRIAADLAKRAGQAPSSEQPSGEPGPESQQDPLCEALNVVALYAGHSADSASACWSTF